MYDAFGNLAQEYRSPFTFVCGTPTCYLTTDHLGSTRIDANGLVGSRYDYLPFGEDVPAGTGGRTGSMGYGVADIINPRYAGQMEDPESARYSMGFRYYSPAEGRFGCPKEAVRLTLRRLREPGAQDLGERSVLMVPGRHATGIVPLQTMPAHPFSERGNQAPCLSIRRRCKPADVLSAP